MEPTDLFDEQIRGLPDFYGKKDKATTEQAFFTCNLCECDLKSIKTLRLVDISCVIEVFAGLPLKRDLSLYPQTYKPVYMY